MATLHSQMQCCTQAHSDSQLLLLLFEAPHKCFHLPALDRLELTPGHTEGHSMARVAHSVGGHSLALNSQLSADRHSLDRIAHILTRNTSSCFPELKREKKRL
jgi:hypothetical protein